MDEERSTGGAVADQSRVPMASRIIFLFESAGSSGEFTRVRGCGFKGLVARFSKFLAQHHRG